MKAREKAIAGWGDPLPDWVDALVSRIEQSNQAKVAEIVGYSDSAISQALRNCYTGGNIGAVEAAVRGAFLGQTVDCPVLGELPVHTCMEHQRRKYANTNSQRVRLFRACRTCANRRMN